MLKICMIRSQVSNKLPEPQPLAKRQVSGHVEIQVEIDLETRFLYVSQSITLVARSYAQQHCHLPVLHRSHNASI